MDETAKPSGRSSRPRARLRLSILRQIQVAHLRAPTGAMIRVDALPAVSRNRTRASPQPLDEPVIQHELRAVTIHPADSRSTAAGLQEARPCHSRRRYLDDLLQDIAVRPVQLVETDAGERQGAPSRVCFALRAAKMIDECVRVGRAELGLTASIPAVDRLEAQLGRTETFVEVTDQFSLASDGAPRDGCPDGESSAGVRQHLRRRLDRARTTSSTRSRSLHVLHVRRSIAGEADQVELAGQPLRHLS